MVTVLWTGSDRFGYAVLTSLHGLPPNFTHALKIYLGRFLSPFRSARLMRSGGNSPWSRFSWRKVWTGVKCNFSSAQLHDRYVDGKHPISRVRMWNFTRIGRKRKKLWLSINPGRRQWPGTTHKKVWTTTFLRRNSTSSTVLESSRSRKLKYAISARLAKSQKNCSSFKFMQENLEKFCSTELYDVPLEGSTIFLYRSSLGRTSMESCRLGELNYAISAG